MNDNEWHEAAIENPPLHNQVLVELREGVGVVCDVACYIGKVTADGETADKWIMGDTCLDYRQIKRWAHIYPKPPANVVGRLEARVAQLEKELEYVEVKDGYC